METLNQIAENIAYQLGDQFNVTLKESIKDTLIVYRSKFLRDSNRRNFDDLPLFGQSISVPTIKVNLYDEIGQGAAKAALSFLSSKLNFLDKFEVVRTKNKVPSPIRHSATHRELYNFVGAFDGSDQFHFTTLQTCKYDFILPNRDNSIFYIYLNNYIYVINNLKTCDITNSLDIKEIFINSVFSNPREAYKVCDDPETFIDDRPFPMSGDLLASIFNMVKRGEFVAGMTKDGEVVNIKPDRTDDK